jgi:hypothetical protein
MARQYLTEQNGGSGLGIGVSGSGPALRFSHGGRDEGFDALLVALAETGQGAVIMINANDNSRFMGRVLGFVARAYDWPGAAADSPAVTRGTPVPPAALARVAGYYEIAENQMITLVPDQHGTGLETLVDGLPDETFLAMDSTRFGSAERPVWVGVSRDQRGAVTGVLWQSGGGSRERRVSRVAPLLGQAPVRQDPDPALTARIAAVLEALRQGDDAAEKAADLTPGAKRDFAGFPHRALDGLGTLSYLGEEDVAGRGLHRHGGDVARVRLYRVSTTAGSRGLLAHLTAEGLVTDYDVVDR